MTAPPQSNVWVHAYVCVCEYTQAAITYLCWCKTHLRKREKYTARCVSVSGNEETIAFPYRKTCVQCWCVNLILFQLTTTTDCARLNCITITKLAKIHTHSHAHMYLVEFSAKTPRYGVWCVLRSFSWIVHSLDSYRELSAFFLHSRINTYIYIQM